MKLPSKMGYCAPQDPLYRLRLITKILMCLVMPSPTSILYPFARVRVSSRRRHGALRKNRGPLVYTPSSRIPCNKDPNKVPPPLPKFGNPRMRKVGKGKKNKKLIESQAHHETQGPPCAPERIARRVRGCWAHKPPKSVHFQFYRGVIVS